MSPNKYHINDVVEIESFGAEAQPKIGVVVDINTKSAGIEYTIQTDESKRDELRWEDEIITTITNLDGV